MKKTTKGVQKKILIRSCDYNRTFSTVHGKRVLYDLMREGHLLGTSFVEGDPYKTAFNEGERSMIGKIITHLKTSPQELERLFEEREKHARSNSEY